MAFQSYTFDIDMQVSPNATSISQYAAVTGDTAGSPGDAIYPAAAGFAVGVSQSVGGPPVVGGSATSPSTPGQSLQVRVIGITKALAAAAITQYQMVSVSGAVGQFGPAAAAGATNSYIVGMALTPATQAGDLFTLLLFPGTTTIVNA